MRAVNDKTGAQNESINRYPIATDTAVKEGQVVKLTEGKVVLAVAAETSPILGVAKENHSGAADTLNQRSNGLEILVSDSPTAVYESPAPRITATGGTTTTIVASALATFADDDFNGGYAKLVTKGASSANTDPVGKVYPITDFVASTKTMTIDTAGGAVTANDVFEIYPPIGFAKGNFDSGIAKLVLTATAALPVKVVDYNTDKGMVYHMAALHEFGNKKA